MNVFTERFRFAASRPAPTRKHKQLTTASQSQLDSTRPRHQHRHCQSALVVPSFANSILSYAVAAGCGTCTQSLPLTNRLAADKQPSPTQSSSAVRSPHRRLVGRASPTQGLLHCKTSSFELRGIEWVEHRAIWVSLAWALAGFAARFLRFWRQSKVAIYFIDRRIVWMPIQIKQSWKETMQIKQLNLWNKM